MSQSAIGLQAYAGAPIAAQLSANMGLSDLSCSINAATGWPTGAPFVCVIDPNTASEEKIQVTSVAGGTAVTIAQRAYDGTTAYAHNEGAIIQPVWDASSAQDLANHVYVTNLSTRNDHTQYLTATTNLTNSHDKTGRHVFGAALQDGTPESIFNSGGNSNGNATTLSRSDHQHSGIPAATSPAGAAATTATSLQYLAATVSASPVYSWVSAPYVTLDTTAAHIQPVTAGNVVPLAGGLYGLAAASDHTHAFNNPTQGVVNFVSLGATTVASGATALTGSFTVPSGAAGYYSIHTIITARQGAGAASSTTGVSLVLLVNSQPAITVYGSPGAAASSVISIPLIYDHYLAVGATIGIKMVNPSVNAASVTFSANELSTLVASGSAGVTASTATELFVNSVASWPTAGHGHVYTPSGWFHFTYTGVITSGNQAFTGVTIDAPLYTAVSIPTDYFKLLLETGYTVITDIDSILQVTWLHG